VTTGSNTGEVARVENTRPSFLPAGAVRNMGNVVGLQYGPPRPRADLQGKSRPRRPGDAVGVPLEGPYPGGDRGENRSGKTVGVTSLSGAVDTFSAR